MEGQSGSLNEAQAAVVLREVLTALDYMHNELRALHRDVKAANVLLTRTGKVKLGDLGVAAQVRPGPSHSRRHTRMTPACRERRSRAHPPSAGVQHNANARHDDWYPTLDGPRGLWFGHRHRRLYIR
mmetsp:Transcript_18070/g.50741  ORF Transcript_18070/g.50741 Transcript_18070/m.50741 type:complete len:127 (+) Transcript_18070:102-482(+)